MQSVQINAQQQRQEGRKGSGEALTSFETTNDSDHQQAEQKLSLLEQQHRILSNQYMAKIREMAETINRQTETKQKLTRQIESLAK
jgi:hypothetical protein